MSNQQWLTFLHRKSFWTAVFGVLGIVVDSTPLQSHIPAAVLPAFEGLIITLLAAFGYQAGKHASNITDSVPAKTPTTGA